MIDNIAGTRFNKIMRVRNFKLTDFQPPALQLAVLLTIAAIFLLVSLFFF